MNIGRLRDRITIQRLTTVNDGGAITEGAPVTVASRIPADVQSATTGRTERLFSSQVVSVTAYVITIRAGVDIQPQDEIVWHQSQDTALSLDVVGIALQGPRRDICTLLAESRA